PWARGARRSRPAFPRRFPPPPPRGAVTRAGGGGTRLPPLPRRIPGDSRPKQFCNLPGTGTLLAETPRRVARLIPPARQLVSLTREHACYYETALDECGAVRPLIQPQNLGTALGVLYPALRVAAIDARPTVAILPS